MTVSTSQHRRVPVGWEVDAACRGRDTDLWFSDDSTVARAICAACPVADECGFVNREMPHGIFGGMDRRERELRYGRRAGGARPWHVSNQSRRF